MHREANLKNNQKIKIKGLRNNNPRGNPNTAPRCGAKTRKGTLCLAPAMKGKQRCRMHGGKSTGARTEEGKKRVKKANFKHGHYTAEAEETRRVLRRVLREGRELVGEMV